MGIERTQHAVDRRFDQLLVGHRLDVIGAHTLEHLTEQIELPVGFGIGGGNLVLRLVGGAGLERE